MPEEKSIRSVGRNGLQLDLMDGSRWEVAVGDNTMTLIWLPTARVIVEEHAEDKLYPYRITNLDTYGPEVVRAMRTW